MPWTKSHLTMVLFVILAAALVLASSGVWAAGNQQADTDANVTFTVLYNFGGKSGDLIYPGGVIAQGRDGNLYTATGYGGTSNDGVVFTITPGGIPTVLYNLKSYNGSNGLTLGTDGSFYGTTVYGGPPPGYGTVFRITPGGRMTVLAHFSGQNFDAYPDAPPIEGSDGDFYGTDLGGFYGNGSTIYKMTRTGTKTTLFRFDKTDGSNPADPLVQGSDGNFYGTTSSGGTSKNCEQYGCGVAFKLTPAGKLTVLHNFNGGTDGFYPVAPLIEGTDGAFYGTVPQGGPGEWGTVFRITRTGKFSLLYSFSGERNGRFPTAALVQATDGNLYGTTEIGGSANSGVIFEITRERKFSVIYNFDNASGAYPTSALVQHTDGKLYGFAGEGGTYNYGTFFSLDIRLGPFVNLVSAAGKVGKSIGILGQGFTGTTAVSFNGKSANFTVESDTFLTATVPQGASTGFVAVTTPSGNLKSNKKFRVIP